MWETSCFGTTNNFKPSSDFSRRKKLSFDLFKSTPFPLQFFFGRMQLAFVATDKIGLEVEPFSSHFWRGKWHCCLHAPKPFRKLKDKEEKRKRIVWPPLVLLVKNWDAFFPSLDPRNWTRGKGKNCPSLRENATPLKIEARPAPGSFGGKCGAV